MKLSIKVIAMMLLLACWRPGCCLLQCSSFGPKTVKLTAQDMQLIFKNWCRLSSSNRSRRTQKKKEAGCRYQEALAVAQVAEQEGYAEHAELKPNSPSSLTER